ncbi:hypothetical protein ACSBR2_027169 [Camellia fascicularis]
MEDFHLLHPLLPNTIIAATVDVPTTTNPSDDDNIKLVSSNSKIILRLFFIVVVGVLSLWANHEASKGFQIKIQNNAAADSTASRQFDLLYVSNDKATRLVLKTSKFVETILYPNPNTTQPKKQVNRVTLGLTSRNLTHIVMVESLKDHEFVLLLSPSIFMEKTNVDHAMLRAVQNGMSRVWLYNNNAPKSLIDGMVEYLSGLPGLGGGAAAEDFSGGGNQPESDNSCWKDENPRAVAHFLNYCEVYKKGFIQRLNQGMRVGWNDRTVEDAIGMPAQYVCASYMSQKKHHLSTSSPLESRAE